MKVRELIHKLLNYDMDAKVELVILGKDEYEEKRYSCFLNENSIEGAPEWFKDQCSLIFHTDEISDNDFRGNTLHEIIKNQDFYYNEWLKNEEEKEKVEFRATNFTRNEQDTK